MQIFEGLEIYSLDDIVINTAPGKNVILNGKIYSGNGIGIRWDKFKDRFTSDPSDIYSTKNVIIRTDLGKKVSINGTEYPSTTGIARASSTISSLYQHGFNWYCKDNIIINIAPGQKIIINDVEITSTPELPVMAGLGVWYDASQLELADGAAVNTWPDLSSPSRPLTKIGAAAPVLIKNALNGLSIVHFDPDVQRTLLAAVSFSIRQYFLVARFKQAIFADYNGLLAGPLGNDIILIGSQGQNYWYQHWSDNTTYYKDSVLIPGQSHPAPVNNIWSQFNIAKTDSPWTIQLQMGQDRVSPRYWDGDVAEVIGYDRILSSTERQQIENYLKQKWAIVPASTATVGSLTPNTGQASSGVLVDVNGTGFIPTTVIQINAVPAQTTYVSATKLTTTYFGTESVIAVYPVGVKNTGELPSNTVNFALTADVDDPSTATVGSLSPNTLLIDSGTLVTVNGTGFTPTTAILANGSIVQTTFVSATSLTTTYLGTISTPSTIAIGVKKPGELLSNTVNFNVTEPDLGFSPDDIPDLQLWLDGDDDSSFEYSSGVLVSKWNDKSGNGLYFDQATVASQPSRNALSNGKSGLTFSTSQRLDHFPPVSTKTKDFTFFIVADRDSSGNAFSVAFHNGNSGNDGWGAAWRANGPFFGYLRGGIGWYTSSNMGELGILSVYTLRNKAVSGIWGLWIDGIAQANNEINSDTIGVPSLRTSIPSPDHTWGGKVYEVVFYNRELTNVERQQVEEYLLEKWTPPPVEGPLGIPGIITWLDASDASTFTLGVTGSAAHVDQWRDKASGRSFIPEHAGKGAWKDKTQNGLSTVYFDGTTTIGGYLKSEEWLPPNDNFTRFTVAKTYLTSPVRLYYMEQPIGLAHHNAAGSYGALCGNPGAWINAGPPIKDVWITQGLIRNTGLMQFYKNSLTYGLPLSNTVNSTQGASYLGGDYWGDGGLQQFELAEVLSYNRVLSETERLQIENYLTEKWFSPVAVPGLIGWWDASDTSTVTESGGFITRWGDKSIKGMHLDESPFSVFPIASGRSINGRNAIDFNSGKVIRSSAPFVKNAPFTICTVTKVDTSGSNNQLIANVNNNPAILIINNHWSLFAGGVTESVVSVDTVNPHIVSAVFNAASSNMWLDGTQILTNVNPGSGDWNSKFTLGNDSFPWHGLDGEFLIYDRVLTTTERQQVESYLKNKWGTP